MSEVNIENLKFSYTDGVQILDGVDLKANNGDFVCFLGQSGCGKSTLLRLIAGLETPNSGTLSIDGNPVKGAGLDRAVVFQDYGLFPWMTAGQNIMIALEKSFKGMSKEDRKNKALEWMEKVGMSESLFHKLPGELSGGQKQRCGIARAFAIDSPILLMDEPFGSLDAVTKAKLQNLVLDLWEQEIDPSKRKNVFFVTHEVDEALLLATRIIVLCQTPAKVIYEHSFAGETHPTRENMYTDPKINEMRQNLIRLIHEDAYDRAQHDVPAEEQ